MSWPESPWFYHFASLGLMILGGWWAYKARASQSITVQVWGLMGGYLALFIGCVVFIFSDVALADAVFTGDGIEAGWGVLVFIVTLLWPLLPLTIYADFQRKRR